MEGANKLAFEWVANKEMLGPKARVSEENTRVQQKRERNIYVVIPSLNCAAINHTTVVKGVNSHLLFHKIGSKKIKSYALMFKCLCNMYSYMCMFINNVLNIMVLCIYY